MPSSRLAYLVRRHYDQLCTAAETAELLALLRQENADLEMDGLLAELMEEHQSPASMPAARMEAAWTGFRRKTRPAVLRKIWRWSAAAALLAGVVAGGWIVARKPVAQPQVVVADIASATDKAVLTLADGSTVSLDSAGRMQLQEQDASIVQQGGLLEYAADAASGEIRYNTLRTPRGGTFRIQLPDGTKVWLNVASSLRYPTAFSNNARDVEMTGEAYFEVKKDAAAPFRVKLAAGAAVEVLGTHFNIAAYEDVRNMTATLTEGSVRVSQGAKSVMLAPNEQAVISLESDVPIRVLQNANTEQVLAWKNGLFHFDNVPFTDVMRQLSRWYDVDVEYRGAVPSRIFSGELQRGLSLQQILEIMKEMKIDVRLEEGRKLVVMP